MKLFNTLSRKKETVRPIDKKTMRIYSCGPTVYNEATIGNLRAYIFNDTLARSLSYLGFPVKHAMNITDVGHLTSDADTGEDKMDIAAKREKKSPLDIAKEYERLFFEDLDILNIRKPGNIRRATDTIKDQIAIIRLLEKKGYTYQTGSAVYFDTSKFKKYGKLSGQTLEEKKELSREELVEDPEKKHPHDFALWIFTTGRHAHHILRWPSPWGEGFPGWHIECSAISRKALGQPFDIHTGGVDHIGVHHENEIAQSEAAFGVPLARIWAHNEHLIVDGIKMSKSIGNVFTLHDLISKGYDPLALRYFCLQAQYRSILNFTWEGLDAAQTALERLQELMATAFAGKSPSASAKTLASYRKDFKNNISDDLNTPKALATVWNLVKDKTVPLDAKKILLLEFDQVLGLGLSGSLLRSVPRAIQALITARSEARTNKQFIKSDALRNDIQKLGYSIDDAPEGTYVTKLL